MRLSPAITTTTREHHLCDDVKYGEKCFRFVSLLLTEEEEEEEEEEETEWCCTRIYLFIYNGVGRRPKFQKLKKHKKERKKRKKRAKPQKKTGSHKTKQRK